MEGAAILSWSILTSKRLVEFLLQSTKTRAFSQRGITAEMAEGDMFTSPGQDAMSVVLSRHLRLPCRDRAQMLSNIQVALDAMQGQQEVDSLLQGLTADDIVDGHREKSMKFLWSVIEKWDSIH